MGCGASSGNTPKDLQLTDINSVSVFNELNLPITVVVSTDNRNMPKKPERLIFQCGFVKRHQTSMTEKIFSWNTASFVLR